MHPQRLEMKERPSMYENVYKDVDMDVDVDVDAARTKTKMENLRMQVFEKMHSQYMRMHAHAHWLSN